MTKLKPDQVTYICISHLATDIQYLLDQYHTYWMPKDIKKTYYELEKLAQKLELQAWKKSNISLEEDS